MTESGSSFIPEVGDVVALISHPYHSNLTNVLISGDPLSVSPLMSVAEIVKEKGDRFESETGIKLSNGYKCKCVWYSHKSGQFEEKWIGADFLKIVRENSSGQRSLDEAAELMECTGKLVSLNTYSLEAGKQKSSLQSESSRQLNGVLTTTQATRSTVTPLLAFLPPIMQLKEVKKNTSTEPNFKKDTGKQIRWKTKYIAKCLWFNGSANKFSEIELPVECIKIMPPAAAPTQTLIDAVENHIIAKLEVDGFETLLELMEIRFAHGEYFLRGFDYVTNQIEEIKISPDLTFEPLENYYSAYSPEFISGDTITGDFKAHFFAQTRSLISKAKTSCCFIRIHYHNGKASIRTLKDFDFSYLEMFNEEGEEIKPFELLKGYCHRKNKIRTFRLDRIEKVEVLNLHYGIAFSGGGDDLDPSPEVAVPIA